MTYRWLLPVSQAFYKGHPFYTNTQLKYSDPIWFKVQWPDMRSGTVTRLHSSTLTRYEVRWSDLIWGKVLPWLSWLSTNILPWNPCFNSKRETSVLHRAQGCNAYFLHSPLRFYLHLRFANCETRRFANCKLQNATEGSDWPTRRLSRAAIGPMVLSSMLSSIYLPSSSLYSSSSSLIPLAQWTKTPKNATPVSKLYQIVNIERRHK